MSMTAVAIYSGYQTASISYDHITSQSHNSSSMQLMKIHFEFHVSCHNFADAIQCEPFISENVLELIQKDPENPYGNTPTHYAGYPTTYNIKLNAPSSIKNAYQQFNDLNTKFVNWVNTKYKQYGVNVSLKSKSNSFHPSLEKNVAEVKTAMEALAKEKEALKLQAKTDVTTIKNLVKPVILSTFALAPDSTKTAVANGQKIQQKAY